MPLTLRNTKGSPLLYSELDNDLNYLLTNMSGSIIAITGSTYITGSLTVTGSTGRAGGIYGRYINLSNTGQLSQGQLACVSINASTASINIGGDGFNNDTNITYVGDWADAQNSTVFIVDDTNQVFNFRSAGNVNGYINHDGSAKFGDGTTDGVSWGAAGEFSAGTLNVGSNNGNFSNPDGFYNDGGGLSQMGDIGGVGHSTYINVDDPNQTINFQSGRIVVASISALNGAISFDQGNITSNGSGKLTTKGLVVTGSLSVSGSNVSITGSNVNVKSNTWSINPTNFTWYGQSVTIGSNLLGTGIQTSGSLTQLGDIQGGNNSTLFTVDDGNSIVKSNVGLNITGSTTIKDILTLTLRTTTPSVGQFTTGSFIVSGSGANVHMYFYNGTTWKQLDN